MTTGFSCGNCGGSNLYTHTHTYSSIKIKSIGTPSCITALFKDKFSRSHVDADGRVVDGERNPVLHIFLDLCDPGIRTWIWVMMETHNEGGYYSGHSSVITGFFRL